MANNTKVVGNENLKAFYNDLKQVFPQYIETTWQELKVLRNNNKLIKGATYRITDYTTTTTQIDTQSAQHNFDILVVADDVNILNENAHAIKHSGDTYFANSKLQAWELKYCLDNDTTRFSWANTENGKGVIYYMKDDHNNEVPYDFKNIQFKRYKVVANKTTLNSLSGKYLGFVVGDMQDLNINDETDFVWCYTFNQNDLESGAQKDFSILKLDIANSGNYNEIIKGCRNNIIKDCYAVVEIDETNISSIMVLNNIVISNDYNNADKIYNFDMFDNHFDSNCKNVSLINADKNNFKTNCYSIIGSIYGCSFGNNCTSNTFSNNCTSNTFGNGCSYNTFGMNCHSNTFGMNCFSNTFSNGCYSNNFGNNCSYIVFSNYCFYNTLLDNANNIRSDTYIKWNTFEQTVSYIILSSDDSGSGANYLQNITIHKGVKGTASARKTIKVDRNIQNSVDIYAGGSKEIILD